MEIKATAVKLNSDGKVKGLATLSFGKDIRVRSISIMESKEGKLFVAMPSVRVGNDYKDVCNPITKDFRLKMNEAILTSFEKGESVTFDDGKNGGELAISASAYHTPYGSKVGDAKLYVNESFVISNISIFETKSGNLYPAMPSYKTNKTDKNGKAVYQEMCSVSKDFQRSLNSSIIEQFKEKRSTDRLSIQSNLNKTAEKQKSREETKKPKTHSGQIK